MASFKESTSRMSGLNMALVMGNFLCPTGTFSSPFMSILGKYLMSTLLTLLYNAVDVYVTSSLAESFGQTIIKKRVVPFLVWFGRNFTYYRTWGTILSKRKKDIEDLKDGILLGIKSFWGWSNKEEYDWLCFK